jgi:hypothetical protein
VHLYEHYNLPAAIRAAEQNLSAFPETQRALFLTERAECNFYARIRSEPKIVSPFSVTLQEGTLSVGQILLFPGRQIATSERLEVLALACEAKFQDGVSLVEALAQAKKAGAIPVIPWSPGKWTGKRGALLHSILESANPGDFLLGDSSLRPRFSPEPKLFSVARKKGIGIISGTDPLPFAGQERLIGTFGFILDSGFNAAHPITSVRAALLKSNPDVRTIGKRDSLLGVVCRLRKNQAAARKIS